MDENKTPENEVQEAQEVSETQEIQDVQTEAPTNEPYITDSAPENTQETKSKKGIGAKISCIAIIGVAAVSALAFALGTLLPNEPTENNSSPLYKPAESEAVSDASDAEESREIIPTITISGDVIDYQSQLTKMYEQCSKSCATVYVNGSACGSSLVVSSDGYIVTNHHVVKTARTVAVRFYNNESYDAEIVAMDSLSDLAVLKIEAQGLVPLEFGESKALKIGESVFAIGTPYSNALPGTLTAGIVSGLDRKMTVTNASGSGTKLMMLIQTDAALNPGNSGGPLFNMAGQVVGVVNMKLLDTYEGLGFAIPSSYAADIINQLIEFGEVREYPSGFITATPKLNIDVLDMDDAREEPELNIPDIAPDGCIVTKLYKNSAINKAGIELLDIITEFNGVRVTNYEELRAEINKYNAGDRITVKICRIHQDGDSEYTTYKECTFNLETER